MNPNKDGSRQECRTFLLRSATCVWVECESHCETHLKCPICGSSLRLNPNADRPKQAGKEDPSIMYNYLVTTDNTIFIFSCSYTTLDLLMGMRAHLFA